MNILIQNYRGWEIYFDADREVFYSHCDKYDRDETKKTFSVSKKFIDDYIKANFEFRPVRFQNEYGKEILLTGMRKDKAFIVTDNKKDTPYQLSKYSEKDWFMYDENNQLIFSQLQEISEAKEILWEKEKELRKRLVKLDVEGYRKQITGEE